MSDSHPEAPAPAAPAPREGDAASARADAHATAAAMPPHDAPALDASAHDAPVPGTASAASGPPSAGAARPEPEGRLLQRDDPSSWTPLEAGIVAALKTVYDPEIPVDIWELGLIYSVRSAPDGHVDVDMTLTSPMCPVAGTLPPEVQRKVASVPGVMAANVDVVWEPPWSPAQMSEGARLELNIPI